MAELWDVYDRDRNKTGRLHERGQPMNAGDYHLVVQIWIMNSAGEFLISKRTPGVTGWANMWETTGGSAVAGDDSLTTALKETREEIGVTLDPAAGQLFKQYISPHSNDSGGALYDVWLFRQEVDISSVVFHPDETCGAIWATQEKIHEMTGEGVFLPEEVYPYREDLFCVCRVAGVHSFVKIEPIHKGWSGDQKYCIETAGGKRLLLRVADMAQYDRKKREYEMMKRVAELGVPMQQPVDFGASGSGEKVYVLLTWADGEDAEAMLPLMSETAQYMLGVASGEILRQIHSIPAPDTQEDWEIRFNRKTDRRIEAYRKYKGQALTSEGEEHFLAYVEKNRPLLKNRPQCYQHGDYHPGNMIIAPDGSLFIIDWNRDDFGDPWEEFNRITFTAHTSPHFAAGQLRGYFGGEPPAEFFKLLAFYIAGTQLGVVGWAMPFGESEVDFARKQNEEVLRWYDNMRAEIPSWYRKDLCIQRTDGVPYRLKAPFDFSFLSKYGKVFKVFDEQDGGNVCFGLEQDGERIFLKFAGAPQVRYNGTPEDAAARLRASVRVYQDIGPHPGLIRFLGAEEIGGGFATRFAWTDAPGVGRMYPAEHRRFMALPADQRVRVFEDILDFHTHAVKRGYVAIDFYDGSILYDFERKKTVICDIDFYQKIPYRGEMGLWGSTRFVSPEECHCAQGGVMDEITTVYTMGAAAFCLLADSDRSPEAWPLSERLYAVVKQAVSDERDKRQPSLEQLIREWNAAKGP
ncbi:MAG: phosphotransferase [Oscillospiraceae bacterium]|nr:phosphotransferase [Oscillospiraceae bacterium]